MYSMRFDMRAPDFGASPTELYEAAVDMCEWAETRGCLAAVICEHHSSPDGYLPTPLILGSAIAARTKQLMMTLIVIISKGRAAYVFGLGYRPEEYQHFGLDLKARGRIADEKLGLLRRLLAGEVVEHDGRRIRLTPLPFSPQGPLMMWGGGSLAAARRAGRYGLGYLAQGDAPGSQEAYEEACRAHGHQPGMTLLPNRDTPSVCFVAPDVDVAWQEIGEHLLHDARMYAEWNPDNQTSAGIADVSDVEELRATSRTHRIFTADEAVAHVRGGGMLTLAPLCGGIPPDIAWKYLRYVDEAVMPALGVNDD
jgi:alkanesulfonate monooxygenase SsuD/methylene tetrahydromethanopterin reductase-like flavin-dependent oxidoreductase (luciferase family)